MAKERIFVAERNGFKFSISESKLKSTPLPYLVQNLNENGFGLGSGHDGLDLEIEGDHYCLICSPYPGASPKCVTFKLI